jgi:MFS family permease
MRSASVWVWSTLACSLGGFAAAISLAPAASSAPGRGIAFILFVGSSVHVASTAALAATRDARAGMSKHRSRYVYVPLTLIGGGALAAVVLPPPATTWLLLGFFGWQFFHFQKQNLGIAALAACADRIAPLNKKERNALLAAGLAGIAALLLDPTLLQLSLRFRIDSLERLAGLFFLLALVYGVAALFRRPRSDRTVGFAATYLLGLFFFAPVFLFHSPYAAVGGMTIAHGFQYLLLVGLVANRGPATPWRISRLVAAFNLVLAGGLALNLASHLHGSSLRVLFGLYLGIVMSHFVVDGGFWKLGDPAQRAFLSARLGFLIPVKPEIPAPDRSSSGLA